MHIDAICETNGKGWLLWAAQCPGAFARGATENEALAKLPGDVRRFLRWAGEPVGDITVTPGAPIESSLHTEDADSDLLLEADCAPMTAADYAAAKLLVLKSARDFCTLFESIPNPDISPRAPRTSFYGPVPRTPREMYDHTNHTTAYYMAAFGIPFENMPDLYANRLQALAEIEDREELLTGKVCTAPDAAQAPAPLPVARPHPRPRHVAHGCPAVGQRRGRPLRLPLNRSTRAGKFPPRPAAKPDRMPPKGAKHPDFSGKADKSGRDPAPGLRPVFLRPARILCPRTRGVRP